MRGSAAALFIGLAVITLPFAGAAVVDDVDDVEAAARATAYRVQDDLPLVWCQSLDCGPTGVVYGLAPDASRLHPDRWPVVECAAVDCGIAGWILPLLP